MYAHQNWVWRCHDCLRRALVSSEILQKAILRNSNCLTFEIDLETARGVNSTVWTRSRLSHEVGFNSYPNYFGVHNHVTTWAHTCDILSHQALPVPCYNWAWTLQTVIVVAEHCYWIKVPYSSLMFNPGQATARLSAISRTSSSVWLRPLYPSSM